MPSLPIPHHPNEGEITDPETYTGPYITTYDSDFFDYCKLGDSVLGTREEIWSYTTGIHPPVINKPSTPGTYYDLNGRRIKGVPQKGVYIQNGRKVVVK